jgi:hypothetical protein
MYLGELGKGRDAGESEIAGGFEVIVFVAMLLDCEAALMVGRGR